MLNTRADDIAGSVEQAIALEKAGCEIIRASIPNEAALELIPAIKEKVSVPLVADIHFDYRLALAAAERGIDKIRINPGNIGSQDKVKAVADCCKQRGIPIKNRRKLRLFGKGYTCKVRLSHAGSSLRKRNGAYKAFGKV